MGVCTPTGPLDMNTPRLEEYVIFYFLIFLGITTFFSPFFLSTTVVEQWGVTTGPAAYIMDVQSLGVHTGGCMRHAKAVMCSIERIRRQQ